MQHNHVNKQHDSFNMRLISVIIRFNQRLTYLCCMLTLFLSCRMLKHVNIHLQFIKLVNKYVSSGYKLDYNCQTGAYLIFIGLLATVDQLTVCFYCVSFCESTVVSINLIFLYIFSLTLCFTFTLKVDQT